MNIWVRSALTACCLWPQAVWADDLTMTMFGRKVEISKDGDNQALKVDDRRMLADTYLMVDEIAVVAKVPVVIGTSSAGGNACEGDRFVLTLSAGAAPRLDRQPESCVGLGVENKGDYLLFTAQPIPGRPGAQWAWTPAEGFRRFEDVAFKPDAGKGWEALRNEEVTHPAGLFSNADVSAAIYALLGTDRAQYERSITGVGSGSFAGDVFVGSACAPRMCTEEEAMLVADIGQKAVYLAWKPFNQKIVVRPPVKQWPAKARAALKDWAAKWPD